MKSTIAVTVTSLLLAASPGLAEDALKDLETGTWVDPLGCAHYFLTGPDTEGYLSEKLNRDGSSVCGKKPSATEWDVEIWIDPDGCAHWYVNHGPRGYLSRVRFPDGRPSCDTAARLLAEEQDRAELGGTIWTDQTGCTHFVADDGFEGFMSARLDRNGRPVCN